jgi:hypothetical protein
MYECITISFAKEKSLSRALPVSINIKFISFDNFQLISIFISYEWNSLNSGKEIHKITNHHRTAGIATSQKHA